VTHLYHQIQTDKCTNSKFNTNERRSFELSVCLYMMICMWYVLFMCSYVCDIHCSCVHMCVISSRDSYISSCTNRQTFRKTCVHLSWIYCLYICLFVHDDMYKSRLDITHIWTHEQYISHSYHHVQTVNSRQMNAGFSKCLSVCTWWYVWVTTGCYTHVNAWTIHITHIWTHEQ